MYRQEYATILHETIAKIDKRLGILEKDNQEVQTVNALTTVKNVFKRYPVEMTFAYETKTTIRNKTIEQIENFKLKLLKKKIILQELSKQVLLNEKQPEMRNPNLFQTWMILEQLQYYQEHPQGKQTKINLLQFNRNLEEYDTSYSNTSYTSYSDTMLRIRKSIVARLTEKHAREQTKRFERIRSLDDKYSIETNANILQQAIKDWHLLISDVIKLDAIAEQLFEKINKLITGIQIPINEGVKLFKQTIALEQQIYNKTSDERKNRCISKYDVLANKMYSVERNLTYSVRNNGEMRRARHNQQETVQIFTDKLQQISTLKIDENRETIEQTSLMPMFEKFSNIDHPCVLYIRPKSFQLSHTIRWLEQHTDRILNRLRTNRYLIATELQKQRFHDQNYKVKNFIKIFPNYTSNKLCFEINGEAFTYKSSRGVERLSWATYMRHKKSMSFFNQISITEFPIKTIAKLCEWDYVSIKNEKISVMYNILNDIKFLEIKRKILANNLFHSAPMSEVERMLARIVKCNHNANNIHIEFLIQENEDPHYRAECKSIRDGEEKIIHLRSDSMLHDGEAKYILMMMFLHNTNKFQLRTTNEKYNLIPLRD